MQKKQVDLTDDTAWIGFCPTPARTQPMERPINRTRYAAPLPDQPAVMPALPPGTASPPEGAASPMERPEPGGPHAIPRRHAPIEQLVRQGSFRGFPALSQKNSPFKRQLSLRLNDLPSTLQRKTDFQAKNPGELRSLSRTAACCCCSSLGSEGFMVVVFFSLLANISSE